MSLTSLASKVLKPKLESEGERNKKVYERKDVVYHISGVETFFIDNKTSSIVPLSSETDLYVILTPPEDVDEDDRKLLPDEILVLKAGRVSCPLSPTQPTLRRNHMKVKLAYLFPMEIQPEEDSPPILMVFCVILPETLEAVSPIVLGFEDLLHKFTLFTIEEEAAAKELTFADAPPLPPSSEVELSSELESPDLAGWEIVYTLSPVHCCVIDLDAEEEDEDGKEEGEEGSYDMGASRLNVLLYSAKQMVAVQVATKSVLLSPELKVTRKFYEDSQLIYFFPILNNLSVKSEDNEDEDDELVLTVVLPAEMKEDSPEVLGFEDILHKFCRLVYEEIEVIEDNSEPSLTPVFEKPELAVKIEKTGYKVRSAIVQSAVKMGKGVWWTSNLINKHVRPNQKKAKVSKRTMTAIYNMRVISGKTYVVSMKTLNMYNIGYKKLGSITVGLWSRSPLYAKLTSGATTKNQAFVKDVFAASTEAVMGVYYGLKDAGRILGECSKAATVNVIQHKYGDEAGYATQEFLNGVRDMAVAGYYLQNAFTPSLNQVIREGLYELFDQMSNFRNWTSARVLRIGMIYFKIPLLTSSNYSVRFVVMTEDALLVFYDKEHYLRSMSIAFPDRVHILEEALRGEIVIRDWNPETKPAPNQPKKNRKKKAKAEAKEETSSTIDDDTNDDEDDANMSNTSDQDSNTTERDDQSSEKPPQIVESAAATPIEVQENVDKEEVEEAVQEGEGETPQEFVFPKKRNPIAVRELSKVDMKKFRRSGFSGIKDMKIRGKRIKTKAMYKEAYMHVAAMPLEEIDYARIEDTEEDMSRRHTRQFCFIVATRDGTFTYFSTDTFLECSDWVEELSRWIVIAKEKRANRFAQDELTPDNPNLPKFSSHDYVAWLPKEIARPKNIASPTDVALVPKKMLCSTEVVRETLHEN